jgi:polyvinyl alcohol dehydrogenase (cytochrome)
MRRALPALAVLLTLAAAPAAAAKEQQSYAAAMTFVPPVLTTGKGDPLRFNNLDQLAQHDLDSDAPGLFDSPLVAAGQSALVRGVDTLAAGTYPFHCSLHSWMHGALTVAGAGGGLPGLPKLPSPGELPNPASLLPKAPTTPLGPGSWPFYGKDLSGSRDGGENGPSWNEVVNMGPAWSFKSEDGDFTGTPVVTGGTLVVGSFGGTVFGLDAQTGAKKWERDLLTDTQEEHAQINASAAISAGRVYVPVAKVGGPQLVALSLSNGAELWRATLDTQRDSDVYGSPVAWNGNVYIGVSSLFGEVNEPGVTTRGSVVALTAATGARVWKTFTVPAGHDGGAVWSTPAVDAATGRLYVGTGNAYHAPAADTTDSIVAFDARNGTIVGHLQATTEDVWNATSNKLAGPDFDFGASPNLFIGADGRKLVGEGQKSGLYWAADRSTLEPVWKTRVGPGSQAGGIIGSTAYDGKRIYGPVTPAGLIWSLNPKGGVSWLSADADPLHFGSVSVANGVVYSIDMLGFLNAREAGTGLPLAKLPLGAPSWGGVAIAGGSVFAVTGTQGANGYVVSYRPRG